jgi:hypothetical protein
MGRTPQVSVNAVPKTLAAVCRRRAGGNDPGHRRRTGRHVGGEGESAKPTVTGSYGKDLQEVIAVTNEVVATEIRATLRPASVTRHRRSRQVGAGSSLPENRSQETDRLISR